MSSTSLEKLVHSNYMPYIKNVKVNVMLQGGVLKENFQKTMETIWLDKIVQIIIDATQTVKVLHLAVAIIEDVWVWVPELTILMSGEVIISDLDNVYTTLKDSRSTKVLIQGHKPIENVLFSKLEGIRLGLLSDDFELWITNRVKNENIVVCIAILVVFRISVLVEVLVVSNDKDVKLCATDWFDLSAVSVMLPWP